MDGLIRRRPRVAGPTAARSAFSSPSIPPTVITISRPGSYRWPVRCAVKSAIAARSSRSPVNGSQLFAGGVSSASRVMCTASGGSGRSVSRFSMRRTGHFEFARAGSSAAAATWSMPKPWMEASRRAFGSTVGRVSQIRVSDDVDDQGAPERVRVEPEEAVGGDGRDPEGAGPHDERVGDPGQARAPRTPAGAEVVAHQLGSSPAWVVESPQRTVADGDVVLEAAEVEPTGREDPHPPVALVQPQHRLCARQPNGSQAGGDVTEPSTDHAVHVPGGVDSQQPAIGRDPAAET